LSLGYPAWNLLYYTLYCSLPPEREHPVVIETGTNKGLSTIVMAQALKDLGARAVVDTVEVDEDLMAIARENVEQAALSDYVRFHVRDAVGFLSEMAERFDHFDFVLLDDDHSYGQVLEEIKIVCPKVAAGGGKVYFDNTAWGDVAMALRDLQKLFPGHLVQFDNCSWRPPGNAIWQPEIPLTETESWKPFVEFANTVRGDPRFAVEDRDRNMAIAESACSLLETARGGGAVRSSLDALISRLTEAGRPYDLTGDWMNRWVESWAASDEASLSRALADFSSSDEGPEARYAGFTRAAQDAHGAGGLEWEPESALTWGSLLNFALAPEEMPVVRLRLFRELQWRLGYRLIDGSIIDQYEDHVEFARWLQAELSRAGLQIRDMLDVQGLMFRFSPPAKAQSARN
jgi:predicted O-methyltransferase YrrM